MPHRGKQNEPQYVVEVAKAVAEIKGISFEEVAEVTSNNFEQLFLSSHIRAA
ncbi:MAG: TatD family hydrolase [Porticoccus sp.]|nr:TatD family hydrolase [Porticoccus sp.]